MDVLFCKCASWVHAVSTPVGLPLILNQHVPATIEKRTLYTRLSLDARAVMWSKPLVKLHSFLKVTKAFQIQLDSIDLLVASPAKA